VLLVSRPPSRGRVVDSFLSRVLYIGHYVCTWLRLWIVKNLLYWREPALSSLPHPPGTGRTLNKHNTDPCMDT
jgi:hypothetical protein